MALVEYTEPRIHICRGSRIDGHQVEFEFRPGAENEVPDDVWENLKEHSGGCQTLLNQGKLKEVNIRYAKSATKPPSVGGKDKTKIRGDGHASEQNLTVADKLPPRKGRLAKVDLDDDKPEKSRVEVGSMKDVNIGKMTSYDAVELVEKVYNEDTLDQFEEQEAVRRGGPRKGVLTAIKKKIADMRTDPTKGSDMAEGA